LNEHLKPIYWRNQLINENMKRIILYIFFSCSTLYTIAQAENKPAEPVKPEGSNTSVVYSDPVKDIDGNLYQTIVIGKQIWMKENLRTTHYMNGDPIQTTSPANLNVSSQEKLDPLAAKSIIPPPSPAGVKFPDEQPKYQWAYDGDESKVPVYGRLYTWYAAVDERKICPEGWHIPSDREWGVLISFLGGEALAGGKLKAEGTEHWADPNIGASNETGFTALGAGGRDLEGSFFHIHKFGAWWAKDAGLKRHIEYDDPHIYRNYHYYSKIYGFSIRCIKD